MKIVRAKRFKFKGVIDLNRKDTILFINLWNEHIEKYGFLPLKVLERDILGMFLIPVNETYKLVRDFYGYTEKISIEDFTFTSLNLNEPRYEFSISTPKSYKTFLKNGY